MDKIVIIGCPGSGKSTYAKKLGQKLNIPVFHLDKLFWKNNWEHVSQDEFKRKQDEVMNQDKWILDGNFTNTIEHRVKKADTVIFFDYSKSVSLWRTFRRYFIYFGKVRPDMGGDNKEKLHWKHIKFIINYPRIEVENILKKYSSKNIIIFRNDRDALNFLSQE